jgi:hypothetical protein
MTMTTMILTPSTLLLSMGSLAAYAWSRRKRSKAGTTTSGKAPKLPPPPASPFVPDSGCAVLAEEPAIERWLEEVVAPLVMPRLDSYDVPKFEHEMARHAVEKIVDDVLAKATPECAGYQTKTTRTIWKALWCEVVVELIRRGKLDEEVDDVVALCADPSFDPRAPKAHDDPPPKPPYPPPPFPSPLGPPPMDGSTAASMDGTPVAEALTNVGTASSRQELSQLGVMRLLEGTAGGAPIVGRSARLVMLAFNPAWPGITKAREDMHRLAAEHPSLAFVEVSFADTQRHFGKPSDVYGIAWALAAAAPDGRVYKKPIARHDPRDAPPSAAQWATMIDHASGFVGYRQATKIVRPRRFGDVVRSTARSMRPSAVAARAPKSKSTRPKAASARRPPARRRR